MAKTSYNPYYWQMTTFTGQTLGRERQKVITPYGGKGVMYVPQFPVTVAFQTEPLSLLTRNINSLSIDDGVCC